MNINIIGLRESGFSIGDEIGAFDGDICVGALKINEDQLLNGYASLVASYSTDDQLQNGFLDGRQILIYTWNKLTGEKRLVQPEILNGEFIFAQNASVMIRTGSLATGIKPVLGETNPIDVFPNPSHGKFTVRFSDLPEHDGRIEVLDCSGRLITKRQTGSKSEEFSLVNPAPGLYLVKAIYGFEKSCQKIIIN